MPSSDPKEILLKHDHWATHKIFESCQKLSDEQFHQKFEMGRGSLHDNLLHMIHAKRGWTDLLTGREFTKPDPDERRSIAEQLKLHDEIHAAFETAINAHPLDQTITRERGGKMYTFTRGAVLTHVTTHGMHHRAQCLNMLRHLGVNPLPPSSVAEWTWLAT